MEAAINILSWLQPYTLSLLVLAALCLIVLLQALLTAPLAFIKEEQAPGGPLNGDASHLSFRVVRTHANSVETLHPFGFALLLAIITGVSAALVNIIAAVFLVARLAFWAAYYSGAGKHAGGPRTLCFVAGLLANTVLIISAAIKLL